jgi:hypothetical protein
MVLRGVRSDGRFYVLFLGNCVSAGGRPPKDGREAKNTTTRARAFKEPVRVSNPVPSKTCNAEPTVVAGSEQAGHGKRGAVWRGVCTLELIVLSVLHSRAGNKLLPTGLDRVLFLHFEKVHWGDILLFIGRVAGDKYARVCWCPLLCPWPCVHWPGVWGPSPLRPVLQGLTAGVTQ